MCGIVGVLDLEGRQNVLSHGTKIAINEENRGRHAAGFSYEKNGQIFTKKQNGKPSDVLTRQFVGNDRTSAAIFHTRYATNSTLHEVVAQPFSYPHEDPVKNFAFGFNGNLPDYSAALLHLLSEGYKVEPPSDTGVMGALMKRAMDMQQSFHGAIESLGVLDGSFSVVAINGEGDMVAARDRTGNRPLVIGQQGSLVGIASEDHALKKHWGENISIRSIKPGESVYINRSTKEIKFQQLWEPKPARCFFEWGYFLDRSTTVDGKSTERMRQIWGRDLARLDKGMDMDNYIVVPVPDTAKSSAIGYSDESNVRLMHAIMKNYDIGRTFIAANDREELVYKKYSFDRGALDGKNIFLVEDSVVRLNTLRILLKRLREETNVQNIDIRIACPPIVAPCFHGIDFPTIKELFARKYFPTALINGMDTLPDNVLEAMAWDIEVHSMKYLPVSSVKKALDPLELCMACVTGENPTRAGACMAERAEKLYQIEMGRA